MSNHLNTFNFEGTHQVRTLEINGKPAFVAKDIAEALGSYWNGTATIAHVPAEWRGVTSDVTPQGNQGRLYLTEEGLYFFVCRSDKPKAIAFQKWFAGVVLPSIHKTGSYSVGQTVTPPPKQKETLDVTALTTTQRLTVAMLVEQLAQKGA